ncbi:hypothetical protein BJ138DRAFT_482467 [Hygrophoropsis aurantiaca]|uniref:Uncharacterized protein n=1 Tax=Hygrophoropsis aurantiaca TaxID=72124 RepID=A0ACB8A341_9AGAM|nr:hypothetical protein BJ138DRAFT_482467 [Hygrophoropsis aurantiaca]
MRLVMAAIITAMALWTVSHLIRSPLISSNSANLQRKLDIARVSREIYQTQALLSRLKLRHTLLLALRDAECASAEATNTKAEIGSIRQTMMEAGITVCQTRTDDQGILDTLVRADAGLIGNGLIRRKLNHS